MITKRYKEKDKRGEKEREGRTASHADDFNRIPF